MSRGTKFREDWSKNERIFEKMLILKEIKYRFEPHTIDLIPSAEGTMGRLKPTQYTPDFSLTIGERKILIEVKGLMRGRDAIIVKLADIYYTAKGIEFYTINQTGLEKHGNKNYYPYRSKGISNRGQKTRTIWELLGISSANDDKIYQKAKRLVKYDVKSETNKMESYIWDLEEKKDSYNSIIEEGKFSTKKYQEAQRKLTDVEIELLNIQEWLQTSMEEKYEEAKQTF